MVQCSFEDKLALLSQHDDGVPWKRVAVRSGVALRTLTRWSAKCRAGPSSRGLKRPGRADRGIRRLSGELFEAIEAPALRWPAPAAAFIHRRVGDIARQRGLTSPSFSTVQAVIAAIEWGLRTLAQEGGAAYRDEVELVFRRTAARPNDQ